MKVIVLALAMLFLIHLVKADDGCPDLPPDQVIKAALEWQMTLITKSCARAGGFMINAPDGKYFFACQAPKGPLKKT